MKSEVIALTSFVTDGRTDGRTPSILMSPPMAFPANKLCEDLHCDLEM